MVQLIFFFSGQRTKLGCLQGLSLLSRLMRGHPTILIYQQHIQNGAADKSNNDHNHPTDRNRLLRTNDAPGTIGKSWYHQHQPQDPPRGGRDLSDIVADCEIQN